MLQVLPQAVFGAPWPELLGNTALLVVASVIAPPPTGRKPTPCQNAPTIGGVPVETHPIPDRGEVILDFDSQGILLGIEVLGASKLVSPELIAAATN